MKPRIWTTVGDLRWLRPLELSHNFCRAISWNARLLYPTKLPRRPFVTFHQGFSPVRDFLVFDRLTLFEVLDC
jgi:hypothetical protein